MVQPSWPPPFTEKKKKVQILYVLYDHFFTHSKFCKLFALQVHVHGENQTFNDRNWAEGAAVQQQLLSEPPSKDTPVSVSSIFGYRAVQSRTPRVVFIILLHFSVSYLLTCVNIFLLLLFILHALTCHFDCCSTLRHQGLKTQAVVCLSYSVNFWDLQSHILTKSLTLLLLINIKK